MEINTSSPIEVVRVQSRFRTTLDADKAVFLCRNPLEAEGFQRLWPVFYYFFMTDYCIITDIRALVHFS